MSPAKRHCWIRWTCPGCKRATTRWTTRVPPMRRRWHEHCWRVRPLSPHPWKVSR